MTLFDVISFVTLVFIVVPLVGGFCGAFLVWHIFIKKAVQRKVLDKTEEV